MVCMILTQRVTFARVACWTVLLACAPAVRADPIQVSFAMESDPEFVLPPLTWELPEGLVPLWRQGLARPEAEYQLRICESIAAARREGFPGMESLKPDVVRILTADSTHPAARFAAARALLTLDAREESETLLNVARRCGAEYRALIEPVLAEWRFEPARRVWLERLTDPDSRRRDWILAAACAAEIRAPAALAPLVEHAVSREQPSDIRLAAARAAGTVAETGLEQEAAGLASGDSIVDRLCAVALLTRHSSTGAQEQLLMLAIDAEPSIAASALAVLLSIDPELVLPLVPQSLQNDDATVRLRAAEAYLALPTPERIAVLAGLLDDPHIDVRTTVRDELSDKAQLPELGRAVRDSAMQVLDRQGWRGQEQAALLLAALEHRPAAPRMIELLESNRPEVMIATAWGLRILAVPETAPALLDKADRQTTLRLSLQGDMQAVDRQVAHLFEALGLLDFRAAEPLLRRYVPKNYDYGELSRGAAVWALGYLHEAEPDDELAAQFMARATDFNPLMPELDIVQAMSIISIGRMHAASQLSALHDMVGPIVDNNFREYEIEWAIEQISGQTLPRAPQAVRIRDGWFLQPLAE